MIIEHDLSLDIANYNNSPLVKIKQYDQNSHQLNISLKNNDVPFSIEAETTAKLRMTKPDGYTVYKNCSIADNIISVVLDGSISTAYGKAPAEIGLYKKEELLLSSTFCINIIKSAIDEDGIISSDDFGALTEIIEKSEATISACEEATQNADNATQLATATAEDIKQRADSGEFNGKNGAQGEPGQPGADGKSATITIGEVKTVESDNPATVTNTGNETDAIFNFEIPRGKKGEKGEKGEQGNSGLGVPIPTALDTGKIPVVNDNGSGYELKNQANQNLELIFDYTVEGEPVAKLVIDKDINGNPFNFRHIYIFVDVATAEGLGNGTGTFWLYLGRSDTNRRIIVNVDRTYIVKRAYIGQIHGLKGFASGSVQSTFLTMSKLDEVDGLPYVEFVCSFPDTFQFQNGTRIVIYGEGRI